MTFRHIFDGAGPRRSSLSPGAPPSGLQLDPGSALARVSQPKKVWAPSQGGAAGTERPQSPPPPSPRLWPRPPVCPSGRGRSGTWSELCTARGHPLRTARRAARRAAHVELRDADVMEPRAEGGRGVAARCAAGTPPLGFSADGLHGARGTHGLRERFHAAPHTPSAPSCASCRGRCSVSHAVSVNRRGVLLCSTTHQAPRAAIASPAQ